ncbi:MAG: nucleoside 2-deoxyribosyltransferase [Parcubacteria group bacterium SW_6_46_9]|nr:MAG: nucleoside 2-deoxyribosyltransferase [Parcubacteria group bacterium SW_6_46_9]
MKIYFAGSIRGGRDDKEVYEKIIQELTNYGDVLTEHVGNQRLDSSGGSKRENSIYKRDMEWLRSADYVVAEVTNPSLGVGYEIGKVEDEKPILCLYRTQSSNSLSAMIAGNDNLEVAEYESVDQARKILRRHFENK